MRSYRTALVIAVASLLTFGGVFAALQLSRSAGAPELALVEPLSASLPVGPASDSLTLALVPGQVAVGVPTVGSEPLLQAAQRGDRLDVLASLPSPTDSRPVTVVVVGGATLLRLATATDPLLLAVSAPDAVVLAHLVLGGTHLAYTLWPADGSPPPVQQPLDERTARALLALPALASLAQPTLVPANPVQSPTETPRPTTYSVQAGESLYGVATRLGVDAGALWWANRSLVDPTVPLVAGTILQVPLFAGFLYQVQPGDTWDSVAATFGLPPADLVQRNELPETAALVAGMLLIVPRQT